MVPVVFRRTIRLAYVPFRKPEGGPLSSKAATKKPKRVSYQQRARATIDGWIKSRGVRQSDVGDALLPLRRASWMSRYLNGAIDADVDTLHQIAAYFGNEYCALFTAPGDVARDPLRARLDAAYAALGEVKRELLVRLAEEFAQPTAAPRAASPERLEE